MSRCESVWQRASCAALLTAAGALAVILANVFIDIDGLIASKVKTFEVSEPVSETVHHRRRSGVKPFTSQIQEEYNKVARKEEEDNYRSKRSLESQNTLLNTNNPKMKNILTDRLATLLEELDEEESKAEVVKGGDKAEEKLEPFTEPKIKKKNQGKDMQDVLRKMDAFLDYMKSNYRDVNDGAITDGKNGEDMLHLAMHNILLQGIIGHMDLNEVFGKVHTLVKSFREDQEIVTSKVLEQKKSKKPERLDLQKDLKAQHDPSLEENKFFEEIMNCGTLQQEVEARGKVASEIEDMNVGAQKGPKLLIKTIIDITSNKDNNNRRLMNSKESIKGIIKLIYNGKSVKFNRMEEEDSTIQKTKEKLVAATETSPNKATKQPIDAETEEVAKKKKIYFNQIIDTYMRKFPKTLAGLLDDNDDRATDKYDTKKRPKRQLNYKRDDNTAEKGPKLKRNEDEDELYIEIETHFDNKGLKGMKKKKLIRNIIDKIQKAIHSDLDLTKDEKKRKPKHLQFKKRIQNPLDKKKLLINKLMIPMDSVIKRHSDPITKSDTLNKYADNTGKTWKKTYFGPGYLTASKSLNSAEMGEVDVDYNKILAVNGIPQRLQKPLNTDSSDEFLNAKTYFDLGNLKFFIKNIDGTGLSIGFNQYTDEPPDPDAVKLFTGIENLLQTYNKNDNVGPEGKKADKLYSEVNKDTSIEKKNTDHTVIRRSADSVHENDYHTNEYKIIFDHDFLPYDTYQEIYVDNNKTLSVTMKKETSNSKKLTNDKINNQRKDVETSILPTMVEEDIFYKKLKPSEILSLATLLDRKKRSMNVKQIKNIKSKQIKVSKFLNTHARPRQKIILKKTRNKRQIDKIRIYATDPKGKHKHSEENIFLIDDDNVSADRAIIREIDIPEASDNIYEKLPDFNDRIQSHIDVYDEPSYTKNIFERRSRHNPLMSKYPHILLAEIARSKEDAEPIVYDKYEANPIFTPVTDNIIIKQTKENNTVVVRKQTGKIDDLVNAIEPKQNYKLTLKIYPKTNDSNVNTRFKEIHTSINKSFNRDGMLYSTSLNVSEISKIVKLNSTDRPQLLPTDSTITNHIKDQQNNMDLLLQQHKRRINDQLSHLKREHSNLDNLSKTRDKPKTTDNDNAESVAKTDLLRNMNKDDVKNLLASALFQLQSENKVTTTLETTIPTAATTEPQTTVSPRATTTTTTSIPTTAQPTVEPIKLKLLEQIQQNENITNEILRQINKNTEMLHTFVQQLNEKITKHKESVEEEENKLEDKKNARDSSGETHRRFGYSPPKFWKPLPAPPNSETHSQTGHPKNESHYTIPFVYAYQNPFPTRYSQNIPVASVIYHGHIHSKSIAKRPKHKENNETPGNIFKLNEEINSDNNQSRYFIDDEMESNFKVISAHKGNHVTSNVTM